MSCQKNCQSECGNNNQGCQKSGTGYIILIVLYILLAIILGSWYW